MVKISIVLLTWNGEKYIEGCIKGLKDQIYINYEVIVVDNNSNDKKFKEKLKEYKKNDNRVKIFFNKENLGFAKGMNLGIEKSNGKYILLLNQDVILDKNFLKISFEEMERNKTIGGIAGKELLWENGKTITDKEVTSGPLYLRKRIQGYSIKTNKQEVGFGINGSFPFLRKKALDEILKKTGYYYDEDFGTGWEDMDLWFRFNFLEWKLVYEPKIKAWHVGSGSAGENKRLIDKPLDYQQRIFRNRYYLILKNIPLKYFGPIILTEIIIPFYYLIKSPKSLKPLFIAYLKVILNIKKIIKKRKKINPGESNIFKYIFRGF